MDNATIRLFVGLLMVLPVNASNPSDEQGLKKAVHCRAAEFCKPGNFPIATIYLNDTVNLNLCARARAIYVATRAFRRIGIDLDWRDGAVPEPESSAGGFAEIIEVQVDPTADQNLRPDALAYAYPMRSAGTRIHVIHERVSARSAGAPNLLGYVLAHEIAHVLQGVPRHSPEGIMKARWNGRDYGQMAVLAFKFSQEDAERILNHFNRQNVATDSTTASAVLNR
jgi:hypothetical protein